MKIAKLQVENAVNPIAIDHKNPVFSWNVVKAGNNWKQEAYRLVVTAQDPEGKEKTVWDSGIVASDRMLQIPYEGEELISDTRYYWCAEVWSKGGKEPVKSPVSYFETALLEAADWNGCFIGEIKDREYHIYRKAFTLTKKVKKAKLFVCGLGHYVFYLNDKRVGNRVLEPGWTDYSKTVLYSAYDVTDLVQEGSNAAGVLLADGMYNVPGGRHVYYKRSYGRNKLRVQLNLTYEDGSSESIVTDNSWRMAKSPIIFCCIYGGEDYDARLMQKGFSRPDFIEDQSWSNAIVVEPAKGLAKCQLMPALVEKQIYQPVQVTRIQKQVYLFDFGANHSGYASIRLSCSPGAAGKTIHMIPAEVLSKDNRAIQPLTKEGYYWNYTCNDEELQEFKPEFTYTGYRYLEISGIVLADEEEADLTIPVLIEADSRFIYPDTEESGDFHCSNQLYNDIHRIIKQAILSNMKSYLTDCPHREKLGWLEQTHLIGPSIMYNYNVHNLYRKISGDMEDSQHHNGLVPDVSPEYVGDRFAKWHTGYVDSPEWGSACILAPWYVYQFYGDISLLQRYYGTMRRYILYLKSKAHHGILRHGLGDWLDIGPLKPFSQNTPLQVVATNIYYYALGIVKQIAEILSKPEDASEYCDIMEEVYREYNELFFDDQTNRYATGSQAAQAMSLISGLYRKDREQQIVDFLVKDIMLRDYTITCGDVGHPYLVATLTKYNRSDILHSMTKITDKPGYGYQVVHGATSLTEEWDGPEPGNPHGSQNHFMLGSIEEWFFSGLAGLYNLRAGLPFGKMIIKPHFPEDMEFMEAYVTHPYGKTTLSWRREKESRIRLRLEIPANLTVEFINEKNGADKEFGSGIYEFLIEEEGRAAD